MSCRVLNQLRPQVKPLSPGDSLSLLLGTSRSAKIYIGFSQPCRYRSWLIYVVVASVAKMIEGDSHDRRLTMVSSSPSVPPRNLAQKIGLAMSARPVPL